MLTVAPKGIPTVDGHGKFVIPGLWDMHSHHEATGEALLPLYVAHGVTGTRDMGSELELILRLRKATASATLIGPQILAAGPILDAAPADWPFRLRVSTAEDARHAVRMLWERAVDFIKVHDRTPRDAYFAIAEEAKRLHLPLAGHVPRGITFEEAADVGQRSFEHLAGLRIFQQCSGGPEYRADACRPFLAWLARRRIWQAPSDRRRVPCGHRHLWRHRICGDATDARARGSPRARCSPAGIRDAVAWMIVGLFLGVAGSVALSRYLQGVLFGIAPADPATLTGVSTMFLMVAVLATLIPARRISRVDPLVALRLP